ncbi:hypothetical protein M9458_039173, partial [Cirrhinus mrigala]
VQNSVFSCITVHKLINGQVPISVIHSITLNPMASPPHLFPLSTGVCLYFISIGQQNRQLQL